MPYVALEKTKKKDVALEKTKKKKKKRMDLIGSLEKTKKKKKKKDGSNRFPNMPQPSSLLTFAWSTSSARWSRDMK